MTPKRTSRRSDVQVARLGAEDFARLTRRQKCQNDQCIYNDHQGNDNQGVPVCFLWTTNDTDAAIYCIFDRVADEINRVGRKRQYRNLDDRIKRGILEGAGKDLMGRWGRIVDMFVMSGHYLPDLRRYAHVWLQQYVESVVMAGGTGLPVMPLPPAHGWDSIMVLQPGAALGDGWGDDEPSSSWMMPDADNTKDDLERPAPDSNALGLDSKSRGHRTSDATRPEQTVPHETLRKRLEHLQKRRDRQSKVFVKCTLDLDRLMEKQQTPAKALDELRRKREAAEQEMAFHDDWIAEMSGEAIGPSKSESSNSGSEPRAPPTRRSRQMLATPTWRRNEGSRNPTDAIGLLDEEHADLEDADCA